MANEFIIKNGFYSNGNSAITGSLIISASGANNDLRVGTNKLFVSSSGNVGIGTLTPTAKLEVLGSYRFGPTTNGSVYFQNQDYGTDMDISSVSIGGWARAHRITTSDSGGAVYFGVYGNNTTTDRAYWTVGTTGSDSSGYNFTTGVHLLKNGNIGIGIQTPTAKLHITNTGSGNSFLVEDSTNPDVSPFVIDNTGLVGIGYMPSAGRDGILQVSGTINIEPGYAYEQASQNVIRIELGTDTNYFNTIGGSTAGSATAVERQTVYGYASGFQNTGSRQSSFGYNAGRLNSGSFQTAVGYEAGYANTGLAQTAVGYAAGYQNTTQYQTAVGYNAGRLNKGLNQTIVGYNAGYFNTGSYQTAMGTNAGQYNSGSFQSTFGHQAGYENTGNTQTAMGAFAGYQNTVIAQTAVGYGAGYINTGLYQSAFGHQAGYLNTGLAQTALGYAAGQYNTSSGQTAVGYSAGQYNSGSSQTTLGYFTGFRNLGSLQTALGYQAGYSNTGSLQTAVGANAGFFNSGSNQTALGVNAGYFNSGDNQTAIGRDAGYSNIGANQTVIGSFAGYLSTGSYQTTIGSNAGYTNKGNSQTAIGFGAGYFNSASAQTTVGESAGQFNIGDEQTAVGYLAGWRNSGSYQTAIGSNAGYLNMGSYQIALGIQAGYLNSGDFQTAVGYQAGYQNSGSNQTAVGYNAGFKNSGSDNTNVGYRAGYLVSVGTINSQSVQSVFLGSETRAAAGNQTNQIVIGYNASGIGSNSVVLGNNSILTTALKGFVGIGTTNPTASLHINNTSTSASFLVEDNTNPDSTPFIIDATGNVGIGTTSPTAKLTVQVTGSAASALVANFIKSPIVASVTGSSFIRISNFPTSTTGSGEYTDIEYNAGFSGPYRYGTYADTNIINGDRSTTGNYGSINFVTSGSTRMTVAGGTSAGFVGIGTTNPTASLHVTNTSPSASFLVEDSANPDSTPFIIDTTGSVGIGTLTPSAKLEVSGSYRFGPTINGSVYFRNWDYGTDMDASSANIGGWARAHRITTSNVSSSIFFGVFGSATSVTRAYWTVGDPNNGSNLAGHAHNTGIHLSSSGNVGIGIQTPTARLHINHTGSGNSFLVEDSANLDTSPFVIDTSGSVGIGITNPSLGILHVSGNINIEPGYAYKQDGQNVIRIERGIDSYNANTIAGVNAGTSGSARQTVFGWNAGTLQTGIYQTAFGYQAGYQNAANEQTTFGYSAGFQNAGINQTAIGRDAGYQNSGSTQTAIGYNAGNLNSGSSQTAVGGYAGYLNTGSSQTAVGTQAGYSNSGNSQTAVGAFAGYENSGSAQTAVGYLAGQYNTGLNQNAIGWSAGFRNVGTNQTAIGVEAGYKNSGSFQTVVGNFAGYLNTGSSQTAAGYAAGYKNSGSYQSAFGESAGYQNIGNNQTVIGFNAGRYNIGANQTAVGYQAGAYNTGSNNTNIGYNAGYYTTGVTVNTGSAQSVFIGSQTTAGDGNRTNQIVIGYNASGIGDNSVVLGNASILTTVLRGFVGIGTTSPTASLHVNNTTTSASLLIEDSTNPDSTPFVINATGSVGIGKLSPNAKLDVVGDTIITGSLYMQTNAGSDALTQKTSYTTTVGLDWINPITRFYPRERIFVASGSDASSIGAIGSSAVLNAREYWGYNGSEYTVGAMEYIQAADDWTPTSAPTLWRVGTVASGSVSLQGRLGIDELGDFEIGGNVNMFQSASIWKGLRVGKTSAEPSVATLDVEGNALITGSLIISSSIPGYSVRLQDGTEAAGKVLVSQDEFGNANWSTKLSGSYEITGSLTVNGNIGGTAGSIDMNAMIQASLLYLSNNF